MSRIAGRNARLYVAITSGGTAEPIAFLNKYSLKFTTDKIDVTAFGDTNKTYVVGLPDSQGDYSGLYDDATAQMLTAAQDGIARKFYLYPSTLTATQYWFGTAFFDFGLEAGHDTATTVSGSFAAASSIIKQG